MPLCQIRGMPAWLRFPGQSCLKFSLKKLSETSPSIGRTTCFWIDLGVVKGHLIVSLISYLRILLLWIKGHDKGTSNT